MIRPFPQTSPCRRPSQGRFSGGIRRLLPLLILFLALPASAAGAEAKDGKDEADWAPEAAKLKEVPPLVTLEDLKSGGRFGAGVNLGSRAGLTVKLWPRRPHGITLDLGSTNFTNTISFALTYAFHTKPIRAPQQGISAQIYIGLGARARLLLVTEPTDPSDPDSEDTTTVTAVAGLRVPFGITFLMQGFPIELFLEAAPAVDFWEDVGFDIEGLGGARIYF